MENIINFMYCMGRPISCYKMLLRQRRGLWEKSLFWRPEYDGEKSYVDYYIWVVDKAIEEAQRYCKIEFEDNFLGVCVNTDFEQFENTLEGCIEKSDRSAQKCLRVINNGYNYIQDWRLLIDLKKDEDERISTRTRWIVAIIEWFIYCIDNKFEDWNYGRPLGEMSQVDTNAQSPNAPITLPEELTSEDALKGLNRAVELGYLTSEYQWIEQGHTRYQQTYLALLFYEKLGYKYKWRPFTELWGYNKLAQTHKAIKDYAKVDNFDELESIFN